MFPVRFDIRTSSPPRSTFTSWPSTHLGLTGRVAERLEPGLQRLHLAVVVGAPDVDQVRPAPSELVLVVGEVVAEVGGRTVGLDEDAVALVAEVSGAQPGCALVLERRTAGPELGEHALDLAPFVQGALGEPRVEVDADPAEVVAQLPLDVLVSPLARLLLGDLVADLGPHPVGHLDEVLALVPAFRRRLAPVPRMERRREQVELVAGVVQVVLAMDLRALRGEQVRRARPRPRPSAHHPRGADRSGWPTRTRG